MRHSLLFFLLVLFLFSGCLKDVELQTETYFSDPENADFFKLTSFTDLGSDGENRIYQIIYEFDESKIPPQVLQGTSTLRYVIFANGFRIATFPTTVTSTNVNLPVGTTVCFTGSFRIDSGTTPRSSQEFCIDVP